MTKSIRTKKFRAYIGASALVVAACAAVGQSAASPPEAVLALSKPNGTPDLLSPAGFDPAPNPSPYCESTEYFDYFPEALRAIAEQDNIAITKDTAWTNADGTGIGMTFETTQNGSSNGQGGAPSGGKLTPMVTYGVDIPNRGLSTIGIIMNGSYDPLTTAKGKVTLSEPLFYTQWVFTDLDQSNEGFDLTPFWTSPESRYQHYGMFGPNNGGGGTDATRGWSFETATPSTPAHVGFFSKRAQNTDGMDIEGRFQVDFYGPITGMDMARYGSGGSGFATGAGCPPIGIAKKASAPVWNAATQKFEVTYTMAIRNNLPAQAQLDAAIQAGIDNSFEHQIVGDKATPIDAADLQVTDTLDLTGFKGVDILSLTGEGVTVNPNYNGVTDVNMLAGADSIVAGGGGSLTLNVAYTPDFTDPDWNDCDFATTNQSKVEAVAAGVPVTDLSDDGDDALPASDNGSGGTDDPTPVSFGAIACQVGLAKDYVEGSTVNNGDGTYTATYQFKVGNYGVVNLTNFVLDDDLDAAYGDAYVSSAISDDQCNALNSTGGLAPGAFCGITLKVVFKPISGILKPWINQAKITASVGPDPTSPITTSDMSQDGTEPDPDGDGDPTNNTEPTPNQIGAAIGLSKVVSTEPTNNGDGTYDVTYTLVATNFGFAYLDNIVVNDDLKDTFGDALVTYETDDKCATATLPMKGDSCEVVVNVTFRPGTQLHWENSADVKGNAGGTEVTDISQDGVDPDPDGDGNPGNNSDPTPVDVTSNPAIKIEKSRTTPEVQTIEADGTNVVEYDLIVTNVGDVQLTDIVITDDLVATFGADRLVSGGITENGCEGVTLLSADQEGGPGTCTAHVVATVRPGTDLGPDTNVASVTGTAPDGAQVDADSNPVDVRWEVPTNPTTPTTSPKPKTGREIGSSLGLATVLFLLGGAMLAVTRRRKPTIA